MHSGVPSDGTHDDDGIGEVVLVSWIKPYSKLEGRRITLDESKCIIYPSHFIPKQKYSNSVMIIPCAGARVIKKNGNLSRHQFQDFRECFRLLSTPTWSVTSC